MHFLFSQSQFHGIIYGACVSGKVRKLYLQKPTIHVEIEGVTPDSIQLAVNSLPHNVSFVSSKKETVMIKSGNGQNEKYSAGTRITIWMKFLKTGFYKISPIDLVINGSFYQIPFNPVEVFENPKFINPQVSVSFNNLNISSKRKTDASLFYEKHIGSLHSFL